MAEVAASLWSVPKAEQAETLDRLVRRGLRRLHWDRSDGKFAVEGGCAAGRAEELCRTFDVSAEAHLMVMDPVQEVDAWTGFCDLVVVHPERPDWGRAVDRIHQRGCAAGLAVGAQVSLLTLPKTLPVLFMSIPPGRAGAAFDEATLGRIAELRARSPGRRIGVDGGVKRHMVPALIEAGIDWVVVGTDLALGDGDARWADMWDAAVPPSSRPR